LSLTVKGFAKDSTEKKPRDLKLEEEILSEKITLGGDIMKK
jgi:hypothetical protein